jgi:flagellar biosynthesis GTPase FlhF
LYNALYYACFVDETLALASAIKAGAEKVAGITRERYVNRLIWLRALSRFHIMMTRDDRQKTSFIRINNVLQNLRLDSADGTLRKQPYCIVLCGFPGCGKTATAIKIAETLIKSRHGKFYSTDVVTLNETDEFQSEYRTNHKVVIFDDVAADREKASSINPWRNYRFCQ